MSNPVVTIGDTIPEPVDPFVVRKTFTRIVYESQDFFVYADGETTGSFHPENYGQRTYLWQQIGELILTPPSFVSDVSWEMVKRAPSGFITAVHSAMPKLIVPSQILVDNGLATTAERAVAAKYNQGSLKDLFEWYGTAVDGAFLVDWDNTWYQYAHVGGETGSQFVTTRYKNDVSAANSLELGMPNPDSPPTGEWEDDELVVKGAFVFLLNVVPSTSGGDSPKNANDNPWSVDIDFGDVTLTIGAGGSLSGHISSGDGNTVKSSLAEGKTKEGPPQQRKVEGKDPYVIVVYPVWNGIVVQSGGQDSRGVIHTSSMFVPKYKEASIFVDFSSGFDPSSPAEVKVDINGGGKNVVVDFRDTIFVEAKNCRIDFAYLPCFFSRKMEFDEWFVAAIDSGTTTYAYIVYPIWTDNGTDYELGSVSVHDSGISGPVSDTTYQYVNWKLQRPAMQTKYARYAGELFGSVLEIDETRQFPIRNGNGHFDLQWSGGSPGNPLDGDWHHYVQSVQVTIDIDGSSGSVVVDKYGVAGQGAEATQKIGAITLAATGGFGTEDDGGTPFFQGLAMGVSDSANAGNATWTIPVVGQERKLEDIMLINVPFFDGRTLNDAVAFLSTYAGIDYDMSAADPSVMLSVSSDVNVPRFDWKSGTPVKAALDSVMEDTLHSYVVRDGKVYVYELGNNGLPLTPGPDRSGPYPDTKMVSRDRTPNFDNLRNEIVVMALESIPEGKGTDIEEIPLFPMTETRLNYVTTPNVPWAKSLFRPLPGALTRSQLISVADRIASQTSVYVVLGTVTIPGNAQIRPYDKWGDYIIKSVSHNIDLQGKTWTTSMELIKATI